MSTSSNELSENEIQELLGNFRSIPQITEAEYPKQTAKEYRKSVKRFKIDSTNLDQEDVNGEVEVSDNQQTQSNDHAISGEETNIRASESSHTEEPSHISHHGSFISDLNEPAPARVDPYDDLIYGLLSIS